MKEQEFERIFREHYEGLFIRAVALLNDEDEAHDVVHDTFEHLWKSGGKTTCTSVRAYLITMVRNKCLDILRHRKVKDRYEEWVMQSQPLADDNRAEQRLQAMEREIKRLPSLTQMVIEVCFVHHSTYKEAGVQLGVSASTVKYHVRNALTKLREVLIRLDND